MGLKELLKKSSKLTAFVRKRRLAKKLKGKHKFIDRQKGEKELCIILAGYKEFIWDNVFGRIKRFLPKDVDVCVLSSGLFSEKLNKICEENNWSYLSTKRNCLTLIQNKAIDLHKNAEMIFKLDEDIFVTENCFEQTKKTYYYVQNESQHDIGFAAPLILVNGYSYVRILEKLNLASSYETFFEPLKYSANDEVMIVHNPETAKFMWGHTGISEDKQIKLPQIDKLDNMFAKENFEYSICPIRFSIGAIYFSRKLWQEMSMFKVDKTIGLGLDEIQLCEYCISNSKIIAVSENSVVGHLSFGKQNKAMKDYYLENTDIFLIKETN